MSRDRRNLANKGARYGLEPRVSILAGLLARRRRPETRNWASIALGALIVSLGMTLPVVGWLVDLMVLIVGVGALSLERRDLRAHLGHEG